MKKFLLTYFFTIIFFYAFSQKEITAVYTSKKIVIDGILDEWSDTQWQDDFLQFEPFNGKAASEKTEVSICYSKDYLYVAAKCYYSKNQILKYLTKRDDFGQADYFGFYVDPFNTGLTGYGFFLTARGVQIDLIIDNNN